MSDKQESPTKRITLHSLRKIQYVAMTVTTFLFLAHLVKWEAVQVDLVTLTLLGFLVIIPLAELIRKVKIGDFEAEIGEEDVERIQTKASSELSLASNDAAVLSEERVRILAKEDPRLALAKVRIELEEALTRLYTFDTTNESFSKRHSLGQLVNSLVTKEILHPSIASAIRDVISLANRAIHGERVESYVAEELAVLGVRLVNEVQQIFIERVLHPLEVTAISTEEVNSYRSSRYKITTVVPLVENPVKHVYIFDQDSLYSFLEGYEEYAEFIVSIERL